MDIGRPTEKPVFPQETGVLLLLLLLLLLLNTDYLIVQSLSFSPYKGNAPYHVNLFPM